jgi:ribonuclease HII
MKISKPLRRANFSFERALWKKGLRFVAGVDEVGRGCFAGPILAGCVVLAVGQKIPKGLKVNDSKKLTVRQKEEADKWIRKNAVSWGIGEVSASIINRVGMAKATKMAFRRAIAKVQRKVSIDFLLIDAFYIPWVKGLRRKNQKAIIDGDEKSLTIAAASIVAKVYRDKLMKVVSQNPKYKNYGWDTNKGYGTKAHQRAILKLGQTSYHRKVFVQTFLNNFSSSQARSGA